MEAGETGAATKANILINEFEKVFRAIEFAIHPRDIPGEAQGKSSNLSWAARYINGKYSDEKSKQNIIVTVLDGKKFFPKHFDAISLTFCTRSPRNSGQPSLLEILYPTKRHALCLSRNSRNNNVRAANHFRPQRTPCPPPRPGGRPALGRSRPLRTLQNLFNLPTNVRLFITSISRGPGRRVGCRGRGDWRGPSHVHQVLLRRKRPPDNTKHFQRREPQQCA